jgi:acetolactate synthase-1/2/3 large subunit
MIVLLGQVETPFLGREAFQEVDLPAFYAEVTRWAATATSGEEVPSLVGTAIARATEGRPGPVMLAVPADLLDDEHDVGVDSPSAGTDVARRERPALEPGAADAIAAALTEAAAPVVIAGGGARSAREALVAVAERYALGVYASFRRQDVFPNDHPLYCGHLTLGTPPQTLRALEAADLVLVVGCRLSEITTQRYTMPRPDQRVLQVDVDERSVGHTHPVAIGAVADARAALSSLADRAPASPPARDWTAHHQAYLRASTPPEPRPGALHPATVIGALADTFPPGAVMANDAGNFSIFAHRYWRFTHPRTQVGPTSGAMGYGVPSAIGAKLADPSRDVVALVGDGGFLMTGQELETAVRYGVPITVVAFRNGLYGTIAFHQARELGRTAGVEIGPVDLAAVARAYGATAWTARDGDEVREALAEARKADGPVLVDCLVDPDVLTPEDRLGSLLDR